VEIQVSCFLAAVLYQLFYNKYNFIFLHTAIKIVYVYARVRTNTHILYIYTQIVF